MNILRKIRPTILALLVTTIPSVLLAQNIVKNSSFEEGAEFPATGWNYYTPEPPGNNPFQLVKADKSAFSIDSTTAHTGTKSVKITSTQPVRCSTSQTLSQLKPGQKVVLSAWIKGDGLDFSKDQGGWVRLGFNNKSNPAISNEVFKKSPYLKSSAPTFGWTQFKSEPIVIPEGVENIYLECYLWQSKGTVWFDDISVEIVP